MAEAGGEERAESTGDIHAEFRHLRANAPMAREPGAPWRAARYDDVRHILRSHKDFSSEVSERLAADDERPPTMLFCDPPAHTRLRALVQRAFTPKQIEAQAPAIEERCRTLVVRMASQERGDLMTALAAPLPVGVIASMLGVEDGDFDVFKRWSDDIFGNIGDILIGTPSDAAVASAEAMNVYFLERIAELRRSPREHLLSDLIQVETEEGRLSDEELLMFCRLLLIAGNETTTSLIVGCARIFHELPETFGQLKRSRDMIPAFIEETLRYHSPFKLSIRRATRDLELSGELISKGDLVLPLIASANRDERVFERADEFIIDRSPNPHLAFGLGIHACLGASLARLEGRIAVEAMLDHLDGISFTQHLLRSRSRCGGSPSGWLDGLALVRDVRCLMRAPLRVGSGPEMARSSKSLPHIPALDGLRGLAVLGILFFHAGHLRGGWLGVDLFFVLSGFLITSLLLNEFEGRRDISLRKFWGRRARRLFPALLLTLFGVALYAVGWAAPSEFAQIRRDGFATLLYVANWSAIYQGYDYWDLFTLPSPLEHCWSLAIEEQLYLLWPPVVLFTLRVTGGSRRVLLSVALTIAFLSAAWMAFLFEPGADTARVYFGTDTRCFALMLGAALSAVIRPVAEGGTQPPSAWAFDWLGLAALAGLGWAWASLSGNDPLVYRGGLFVLALAAAATIAAIVLAPRGRTARLLGLAPLRALGTISYGVYLWHWPLYVLLDAERTGLGGGWLTLARIASSFAIATASYWLLERPIRRGALTASAALGLGAASTAALSLALVVATPPQPDVALPTPSADDRAVDVLLVGDSVAMLLAGAFEREARSREWTATTQAMVGCTQLESSGLRTVNGEIYPMSICKPFRRKWRAWAAKHSPRLVVLLDGWPGGGMREVAGGWHTPCDAEYLIAYANDLERTIAFLRKREIEPVLVTAPPPRTEDVGDAFVGIAGLDRMVLDGTTTQCQNDLRKRVASRANVPILDMASWVCPGGECVKKMGGVRLRRDGVHFRGKGAVLASRWLFDRLEELPQSNPGAAQSEGRLWSE